MASKTKASTKSAGDVKSATKPEITGKLGRIVKLLRRKKGARLTELIEATGWQAHSVRGALAGALKKKHGLQIISTKSDSGRIYSTPPDAPAEPAKPQPRKGTRPC